MITSEGEFLVIIIYNNKRKKILSKDVNMFSTKRPDFCLLHYSVYSLITLQHPVRWKHVGSKCCLKSVCGDCSCNSSLCLKYRKRINEKNKQIINQLMKCQEMISQANNRLKHKLSEKTKTRGEVQ